MENQPETNIREKTYMGEVAALAGTVFGGPVGGAVGSIVGGMLGKPGGAGGASGGGLFDVLGLAQNFTSALGNIAGQLGGPLLQGAVSQFALPFGLGNMSPQTFNNPMPSLQDASRCLDGATCRFDGARDHRTGGVRDHRTDGARESRTVPLTRRDSGPSDDVGRLEDLQGDVEAAKQAVLDDPTNIGKQQALGDALQKFQNVANALTQIQQINASVQSQIIGRFKVG
jgi:hypothetical protein